MAAGSVSLAPVVSRLNCYRTTCFLKASSLSVKSLINRNFAGKIRMTSATATDEAMPGTNEKEVAKARTQILACPICYEALIWNGAPVYSVEDTPRTILKCNTCRKTYSGNETNLDLTVTGDSKKYGENKPAASELFRFELISYLYERGWRQTFTLWGGFPGPQKEFELMKEYLKPVLGGSIIDASCASGMFSRLFAKSGLFSLVVALDYSETMLKQCYDFINQDPDIYKEDLILVRADIARLPFATGSVDAVHAGAALHCWPSPSAGVAEISRVLRPGGVFVATTFVLDGPYSFIPLLGPIRQSIGQISGARIFLSDGELKELCGACGLVDYTCFRNRRFVMISARKPN